MTQAARILHLARLPALALAGGLLLLAAAFVLAYVSERNYADQKIREAAVQAQILAASVTAALAFDDDEAAADYVEALRVNPEIRAAAVYDADGRRVSGYVLPGGAALPDAAGAPGASVQGDWIVVFERVVQGDAPLGTVYLRIVREPPIRQLARYGGFAVLLMMASLLVAVLAAAQAKLAKANRSLEAQAHDLAEANRQLQLQIAERERAEEALRQSQKMEAIGQLSGGIAHDFNNLLTIVRGNLQLLQKRVKEGNTDVARYVDLAMEGLTRATNVTQRILAFSRRQPLTPEPVQLSRLVESMAELLPHSLGERIKLDLRLDGTWWTFCDANQMENVVLNLAINARDAMPQGGRLTISTSDARIAAADGFEDAEPGEYVRLDVRDEGIGMSQETLRRALEPFFTTKPQGQGTGLGLSMIFGFVRQSRGALRIDSAPGKGTTVSILLPRDRHGGTVAAAEAAAPDDGRATEAHGATILLVEDEVLVRMFAAETLRDEGYKVIECGDGDAALKLLQSEAAIDLLVTDVKLPGLGGFQLAEAGLACRPRLRVIVMTGYTPDAMPPALAAAGVPILNKPYDVAVLVRTAKAALDGG